MTDRTVKVAVTNTAATDPSKQASGIGPSPLKRDLDDSAIANPNRRLFFNGSSYSGADIKVLVHKYHPGPINIIQQFESAIGAYQEVLTILENLKRNAESVEQAKLDFDIEIIDREEYDRLLFLLWRFPAQTITEIEGRLPEGVNYNQFVGKRILEIFLQVQIDAGPVPEIIENIQHNLNSMITGWKQQKDALEARKESGQFFQTKVLAELQTLSVSTYREKTPVRAFGRSNPQGWVRGQRTIAGSMIFTVFDRNVLWSLLDFDPSDFDGDNKFKAAILDQLPPIDITIQFANEYGSLSRMTIYGVEFVSEGQTMSIEDILLENTVQYIARDVDPMTPVYTDDGRPYSEVLTSYNQAISNGRRPDKPLKASDLLGSDWGRVENDEDASETRFKNRYNPFY